MNGVEEMIGTEKKKKDDALEPGILEMSKGPPSMPSTESSAGGDDESAGTDGSTAAAAGDAEDGWLPADRA